MALAALLWLGLFIGALLIVLCEALGCLVRRVLGTGNAKMVGPPEQ